MQSGMFVVICMASIFHCMSGISPSLFSFWFCLYSQSAMNRSGPGLCMILTIYWIILTRIYCSLCDSIATSFWLLLLMDCDLWLYSPVLQSSNDGTFWVCIVYPVPLFQCCYIFFSALDRLLLTNAMGLSMLLSGALSLGQLEVFLGSCRLSPSPTPDASVSRYSQLVLP